MTELWSRFPSEPEIIELDAVDIGRVLVTVHEPVRDSKRPLREQLPYWKVWIQGPTPEARADRYIYERIVQALKDSRPLPPVILQGEWDVHDGRHRLLAMYDLFALSPDFRTNVYWVHAWEGGVLAHFS